MKCSTCGTPVTPDHVYIIAAYWPMPYVLNLHPSCLREILGRYGFSELTRKLLNSGWSRLDLPGLELKKP